MIKSGDTKKTKAKKTFLQKKRDFNNFKISHIIKKIKYIIKVKT